MKNIKNLLRILSLIIIVTSMSGCSYNSIVEL